VRILDFDRDDCVPFGATSRGTPLAVSRVYAEADLRVCTGSIDYHFFAGYSGGSKSVLPGVSATASIQANHKMLLEDAARAGVLEGNPVREDMDEAGAIVGIDFLFNVLIDGEHRVVDAVAGEFLAAHRAGCALHDERCDLRVDAPADVVVASPGGAPKDIDLYQAEKTLENVAEVVRDGGVVVLAARCDDGMGHPVFAQWMTEMEEPADLVERIRREFVVGGHKAAAVAALLMRVSIFLVSDLPDDLVTEMRMTPFATVDDAVAAALQRCGDDAGVLVVPHGVRVTVRT
jgi:nickel-dependent lactate racemase